MDPEDNDSMENNNISTPLVMENTPSTKNQPEQAEDDQPTENNNNIPNDIDHSINHNTYSDNLIDDPVDVELIDESTAKDNNNVNNSDRLDLNAATIYNNNVTNRSVLEEQRQIVDDLLDEFKKTAQEGSRVFIIPQTWYVNFLNADLAENLDPINTKLICKDFDNFIFKDYNRFPYVSIPQSVFEKFFEWYGLAANSQPIEAFLIWDNENNTLVTEFNRLSFRLHHLTLSNQSQGTTSNSYHYHNMRERNNVVYFSASRFHTVKQLTARALDVFLQTEKQFDNDTTNLKVWVVSNNKNKPRPDKAKNSNNSTSIVDDDIADIDEEAGNDDASVSNSVSSVDDPILSTTYRINPRQFIEFGSKIRLTREHFETILKDCDFPLEDFVIEVKPKGKQHHWLSNYFKYNYLVPSTGTLGLVNLGNTCYMNSALQCLIHLPKFNEYFLLNGYQKEINLDNPIGYQGNVANAFGKLIHKLFEERIIDNESEKSSFSINSFSPTNFKSTVGYCNSMFSGYLQQDSQEFLAFILDGLHEDLNRILKKPFVEKPSLPENSNYKDYKVIKKLADDTWEAHLKRNDSIVTDLFVGMYKSTLQCPDCHNVSVTFDPYNDLTLPLPVETIWNKVIKIFPSNSPPCSLEVELEKTSTYNDLKEYISRNTGIAASDLFGFEIFSNTFYSNYEAPGSNGQFLPLQELIADSDDVIFYEIPDRENNIVIPILNMKIDKGFRSPRLFGVPFFITLTNEEASNPGFVRYIIEKYYTMLSGGFIEFPLFSSFDGDTNISQLPELSKKYPDIDFTLLEDFLKYSNPDESSKVNQYFDIRISKGLNNVTTMKSNTGLFDNSYVWTPSSSQQYGNAKDIKEFLHPVIRDIYDYASLFQSENLSDEPHDIELPEFNTDFNQLVNNSNNVINNNVANDIPSKNSHTPSIHSSEQPDLQLDSLLADLTENIQTNVSELDKNFKISNNEISTNNTNPTTLDNINIDSSVPNDLQINMEDIDIDNALDIPERVDSTENYSKQILFNHDVILCQWDDSRINTVFYDEQRFTNWEKPAVLKNTELEKKREEQIFEKEKTILLDDCLRLFSKPEILGLQDSWYCPTCKDHRQATKQIELWNTPDILLIHLKRFENQRSFSDKIDAVVNFPITDLDLTPHIVCTDQEKSNIYDLIAVDNHYGGLGGGHYTAYVKNFVDQKWYYFDDSRVSLADPQRSISGSAYLLFYVRRSSENPIKHQTLDKILEESRNKYSEELEELRAKQDLLYETNRTDTESESESESELETNSDSDSRTDSDDLQTDASPEEKNKLLEEKGLKEINTISDDLQGDYIELANDSDTGEKMNSNNSDMDVDTDDAPIEKTSDNLEDNPQNSHDFSVNPTRSENYCHESLEVGQTTKLEDTDRSEDNTGRRKLRLLNRNYGNCIDSTSSSNGSNSDHELLANDASSVTGSISGQLKKDEPIIAKSPESGEEF
ncbi:hypothetical protein TBLA_0J00600 [Henningerozyma blattae CBS 6284]|uniref:ubiquitinyl hydrolase 1 n=1 Tax=Henningerozyma blattae (strain ATCC 34711 / CBS 6284 / DSM 70876 / NBRC 10599 / NRRL Y-10934 / UCD 77-7) TaxID=1071380 RepID=I2H9K8_HENB6|nr:hypothetical protein TBLA_0J00600 [Tetrapisispora blattae CBS 6284]CCH63060.1 hypothetical protein TBLA_0J00600 [Tetrapisispora blattae CBS 6284]